MDYKEFAKQVLQTICNCDRDIYVTFEEFINNYSIKTDHCCQDKLISKPVFEIILQFANSIADFSIHFADYDLYSLWKIIYI